MSGDFPTNYVQETTVDNIRQCSRCGMWTYGTHYCSKAGSDSWTSNTWHVSYDREVCDALERIAAALEKIDKRLKKLAKG